MKNKKSPYHQYKSKLRKHHQKAIKRLKKSYPVVIDSVKNNSLVTIGGALMVSGGLGGAASSGNNLGKEIVMVQENQKTSQNDLKNAQDKLLNSEADLSEETLKELSFNLSKAYGLTFTHNLDNKRLNTNWGYFGQEQHLYRWPGDNLSSHIQETDHGMAPGKGAFGYFDNAEQEKYYIATQLHLIPDWNDNWSTLKPFYRFRKVLVYNPVNNKAVIATIGDAGPAKWTGKQFGGSPELMAYLNMVDGSQKSKALVLFLDGSEYDDVPLGPISNKDSSNLITSIL
ncbi:hypothetical protein GW755_01360 [bacterium]|nr:hypothetical protein [bacterium]